MLFGSRMSPEGQSVEDLESILQRNQERTEPRERKLDPWGIASEEILGPLLSPSLPGCCELDSFVSLHTGPCCSAFRQAQNHGAKRL